MKNFENKKPMTKKDEFIANWQPEFGADQHIFKEHLATLIQSECEAFGEFIRVNKWQGDMNNTWRQMFTGSSKTTSELYNSKEFTDYKNRKV